MNLWDHWKTLKIRNSLTRVLHHINHTKLSLNFFPSCCTRATANRGHSFRQWPGLPQLKHVPRLGAVHLKMEMGLWLLDLPWKKKNGENSFLRIKREGWVWWWVCNCVSLWSRIPDPGASLRSFGGARFGYFPLSFFFCFLHFLGVLIISACSLSRYSPTDFQP